MSGAEASGQLLAARSDRGRTFVSKPRHRTRNSRHGVRNAAVLVENFIRDGFTVTMSDVIDAELLATYRRLVPGLVVFRLLMDLPTARVRARTRPVYLTEEEFETLHSQQRQPLGSTTRWSFHP